MEYGISYTVALTGLKARKIIVQTHIENTSPYFNIVGLGDKAVSESKERIRAALSSIGISLPAKRIIVNLAPADLQKEGSHYDLAIIISLLAALKLIPQQEASKYIFCAELALDASISSVSGILPAAIFANQLEKGFICSKHNAQEATISGNNNLICSDFLTEIIKFLKGEKSILPVQNKLAFKKKELSDFSEVKGLESCKRALEIAAAGRHNVLMIGPPGAGKSMLAERFKSILPELSAAEQLELATIQSITGEFNDKEFAIDIPLRSPHHSASLVALTGGGSKVSPGEVTLAHHGILFLDELPEFKRSSLEALRQPLESKEIHIARAEKTITYPANFQLIAAMNPCKCGYLQIPEKACNKVPLCAKDYMKKISGPLLERIDLICKIPYQKTKLFTSDASAAESSAQIRNRVSAARMLQKDKLANLNLNYNSELSLKNFENNQNITASAKATLENAIERYLLSNRAALRILRVAQTIADLAKSEQLKEEHILEALNYRLH